eukprot:gnl/TRDRNA2_/TRDRNA2_157825_c2_seq4.p1 gnl/TRDRNA2_/TRDRNA2_157825_c2~~gnl/TRDRNA2_/TRDRNA2_157825_c2_seq4.p1  ORF type:complete len:395 (+),score=63.87 gnl/TRDRNA2_/TRDRNA2_157825_c2_seq4:110-1294(+)
MILYQSGVRSVLQIHGSVFPFAAMIAFPCALVAGILKYFVDTEVVQLILGADNNAILSDAEAYSGFGFLVGFLIVFRTNQAYNRFWEGVTSTTRMEAEWFDSASSLVAFCKHSNASEEQVLRFQNLLIRLYSLLMASAVAEIEYKEVWQDENLTVIDLMGIDTESLKAYMASDRKVCLVFQWIMLLICENMKSGVLSIPPPIMARAFQEFATGMVNYHEAVMISSVPFPFPFAQTTEALLILHWSLTPFALSMWVGHWVWAFVFTVIQVFILWSLNFIAKEIENPFGEDANDLELAEFQRHLNEHLKLLLNPKTLATPSLSPKFVRDPLELEASGTHQSLADYCTEIRERRGLEPLELRNSSDEHERHEDTFDECQARALLVGKLGALLVGRQW